MEFSYCVFEPLMAAVSFFSFWWTNENDIGCPLLLCCVYGTAFRYCEICFHGYCEICFRCSWMCRANACKFVTDRRVERESVPSEKLEYKHDFSNWASEASALSIHVNWDFRYICSRSSRFMRVFSPYTPEALWTYRISGKFNVRGSLRFQR